DSGASASPLAGLPTTDQRGLPRSQGAATDIGAFEVQPQPAPPAPPQPPASALPQVFAYAVAAPRGQVGLGGFVLDPDGSAEPQFVMIDWHDGAWTFLRLVPGTSGFGFFPSQWHAKHRRHQTATVYVADQQVLAGGGFLPHFDVAL